MDLRKNKNIYKLVLIILCGLLDFLINFVFVIKLKIPLFLDTQFAIAILFLYGPVESIFSYFVRTLCETTRLFIMHGKHDNEYLYFLSIVVVIIITWLFIRKEERLEISVNRSFLYLLLTAATAAAACSFISGTINYFTYQNTLEEWAYNKIIFSFRFGKNNLLLTCIVGRYPITVLDRVITTFAGFGIYYAYKSILHKKD